MHRANRIHKSVAARKRRRKTKEIIHEKTMNLFSRMRRLRKKRVK